MISKMNYLLLSTMMVVAIDSTFCSCCPCAKGKVEEGGKDDFGTLLPNIENNTTPVKEELSQKKKEKVEDGEKDDFETKIISSSHDNDKKGIYSTDTDNTKTIEGGGNMYNENITKDDVKVQGKNDDGKGDIFGHGIRNSDSNVKKTKKTKRKSKKNDDGNVVILEHGIRNSDSNGKKTRKTKGKRKKDDITLEELDNLLQRPGYSDKNNVVYENPIQTAIQNSFACDGMCKKCQESNGSIEVITFTKIKSNKKKKKKKTSKLPHGFCKKHEKCRYKECEQKARYLFQCGHGLCKTHHDLVIQEGKIWFCDLCDIAVCGLLGYEHGHRICRYKPGNHLVCFKKQHTQYICSVENPKIWQCDYHMEEHIRGLGSTLLKEGKQGAYNRITDTNDSIVAHVNDDVNIEFVL